MRFIFTLDEKTVAIIRKISEREYISMAKFIRDAIDEKLKKQQSTQK